MSAHIRNHECSRNAVYYSVKKLARKYHLLHTISRRTVLVGVFLFSLIFQLLMLLFVAVEIGSFCSAVNLGYN